MSKELGSPSDEFKRLIWTLNYVSKILDWELVSSKTGKYNSEFQLWFENRFPDIAEEGQKLLAMIREIGYDTPARLTMLFEKIIRENNLGSILSI